MSAARNSAPETPTKTCQHERATDTNAIAQGHKRLRNDENTLVASLDSQIPEKVVLFYL
jgi:hypothetical protein